MKYTILSNIYKYNTNKIKGDGDKLALWVQTSPLGLIQTCIHIAMNQIGFLL